MGARGGRGRRGVGGGWTRGGGGQALLAGWLARRATPQRRLKRPPSCITAAQGVDGGDVDLPTVLESTYVTNLLSKVVFTFVYLVIYGVRPLVVRPKAASERGAGRGWGGARGVRAAAAAAGRKGGCTGGAGC